jgi:ATP-binding cassette subfamily F protein 3
MISVNQLSVSFGGNDLFDDVSFMVNSKDRVGLVGKNGAGKSTLLKILSGSQQSEKGTVTIQSGCTVGYLPQEMVYKSGKTVFDETTTAFEEVKRLEKEAEELGHALATREDHESPQYISLITRLNEVNDRLHLVGGFNMDAEVETVLMGLGFLRTDFTRLTDEFSGGWRMRIELAKILLQKPNVMLLDEPTNHLDIESIQWLEDFLKNYFGAVILVSHDRAFLDNITTRTIEIAVGKIYDYKTNYSKYVELRKERRALQIAEQKNQEKYIEHTEELINKFRAKKNKAAFAQSLIKKLDKLERVEVDDEDNSTLKFNFPPAPRSGKVVVEAKELEKAYGNKTIFKGVDFFIERAERIAFVGKNGEGKSTLSKIVAGVENYEGTLNIGHNVSIGYYAQNQAEMLDTEKTVFETIDDVAVGDVRKNVRTILGSFLFSGDSIDKKVKVLSGGEKSRLAMCKLILQPYNLLVLDEPTNHLDMRSKDMLKNALLKYDGTLLIVSHDRDFLQGLTGKVFEFRNKSIKPYIGDVYEFLKERQLDSFTELEKKKGMESAATRQQEPTEKQLNFREKKEQEKELRKITTKITNSEKEIGRLEKEIKSIDDLLLDPEKYKEAMGSKDIFTKYEELKKLLEQEMNNWETLNLQLSENK